MHNIGSEYKTLAAYALFYQLRKQNISSLDIVKKFIRLAALGFYYLRGKIIPARD